MIVYRCEFCKTESTFLSGGFIVIGSKDSKSLFVINPYSQYNMAIANYRNLHLCSKDCLIKYFFGKDDE